MLAEHCRHARYVWNLAVEQQQHWRPGRHAPGYSEQAAQLTEARAEYGWLRAGSQTVQQQALRGQVAAGDHGVLAHDEIVLPPLQHRSYVRPPMDSQTFVPRTYVVE